VGALKSFMGGGPPGPSGREGRRRPDFARFRPSVCAFSFISVFQLIDKEIQKFT
jgi:hypothetical protein